MTFILYNQSSFLQFQHDANDKVLPWLYHDKPTQELTPKRRFSNAIINTVKMNITEHGYRGGAANHWSKGSHKPFATSENKPIVLYTRPASNQTSVNGKPAIFNSPKVIVLVFRYSVLELDLE